MRSGTDHYLQVDDLHSIYYQVHGHPEGTKVLFLHGGPGLGTSQRDLAFFDLDDMCVVLFDQRGSGASKPKAELRQHTTQDLIQDINQLLAHLGWDHGEAH